MNINRKRRAYKLARVKVTLKVAQAAIDLAKEYMAYPMLRIHFTRMAALDALSHLERIRHAPTDPFDVLDVTQCGTFHEVITIKEDQTRTIRYESNT